MEELGINLGADVCLYEEDDKSESSSPDNEDIHDDFEMHNHVDILADQIVKDLATDAVVINGPNTNVKSQKEPRCNNDSQPAAVSSPTRSTNSNNVSQLADSISKIQNCTALEGSPTAPANNISPSLPRRNAATAVLKNPAAVMGKNDAHLSLFNHDVDNDALKKRKARQTSSSADEVRSLQSGSWSVDWLRNVQHGDIGLISSKKKRLRKVGKGCGDNSSGSKKMASKEKVGGVL